MKKALALYGGIYVISYTLIIALSSIFRTYFPQVTVPLLVALYVSNYYAKNTDTAMNTTEKIMFISMTFFFTLAINIMFTANVIGEVRSIDQIGLDFEIRQLMQLTALSITFGSNDFYAYMKRNDHWWNLRDYENKD
jgi:hypothetical protein